MFLVFFATFAWYYARPWINSRNPSSTAKKALYYVFFVLNSYLVYIVVLVPFFNFPAVLDPFSCKACHSD